MGNEEKILQHLLQQLREREQSLSEHLGNGAAKDYADYRDMCGQIQGLLFAQRQITDLVRKLESFEDE